MLNEFPKHPFIPGQDIHLAQPTMPGGVPIVPLPTVDSESSRVVDKSVYVPDSQDVRISRVDTPRAQSEWYITEGLLEFVDIAHCFLVRWFGFLRSFADFAFGIISEPFDFGPRVEHPTAD